MPRRGQASLEYMTLFSLSLISLLAIWLYTETSNDGIQQDLRIGYAKQAVTRLADAANIVHAQGYPAKMYVDVIVPERVVGAYPNANPPCAYSEVLLTLVSNAGGITDVPAPLAVNVTGDLAYFIDNPGPKRVWVESIDYGGRPCIYIHG